MNIILFSNADIFIQKNAEAKNDNILYCFYKNDERYKHIKKILHLKENDLFKAGFINGKIGKAIIKFFSEEKILFSFTPLTSPIDLPPISIILGFPRPIQLRRILRDGASLGFSHIILTSTDLTEKSYLKSNLVREDEIKNYLLDGISQAGQSLLPKVSIYNSLNETLNTLKIPYNTKRIFFDIGNYQILSSFKMTKKENVILAIGSERGWSDNERSIFKEAGFSPYSMGKRVLRTETALLSALSVIQANNGNWT